MKRVVLLILSLSIISCATTTTEFGDKYQSLLVGEIQLKAKNFAYYGDASVNGTHSEDIELTFMNITENKEIIVNSYGKEGVFYFPVKEDCLYQLTKLYYKKEKKGSWVSIKTSMNKELVFDVLSKKVNNVGVIDWECDNKLKTNEIMASGNYDKVREDFVNRYHRSNWLQYEWSDRSILSD